MPSAHTPGAMQASVVGAAIKDTYDQEKMNGSKDKTPNPIDYLRETGRWPGQYFKQDDQTRKDLNKTLHPHVLQTRQKLVEASDFFRVIFVSIFVLGIFILYYIELSYGFVHVSNIFRGYVPSREIFVSDV
jgi:hypothetical protein